MGRCVRHHCCFYYDYSYSLKCREPLHAEGQWGESGSTGEQGKRGHIEIFTYRTDGGGDARLTGGRFLTVFEKSVRAARDMMSIGPDS
ncbi:unnamed protein product [Pleuronectes platessa]|uniref:Uncharacterized protein n=1 Tax=Pleuronectes platessa TaxID=8262 RepID=A0A9N7YQX2_PLEPL|nr:unnamed protein product [Pleuronectes platessa]